MRLFVIISALLISLIAVPSCNSKSKFRGNTDGETKTSEEEQKTDTKKQDDSTEQKKDEPKEDPKDEGKTDTPEIAECKNMLMGTGKIDSVSGLKVVLLDKDMNLCEGIHSCKAKHSGSLPWPGLKVSAEILDCMQKLSIWMINEEGETYDICKDGQIVKNSFNLKSSFKSDEYVFPDPSEAEPNTKFSIMCFYK